MANGTLAASQLEMLSQDGMGITTIVPPATNTDRTLTLPDGAGTVATAESTLAQFSASGSAPVFAARAWVNFNGTGTVAIRASGNVSSITDNGTGDYTLNFTTAMEDANYAIVGTSGAFALDGGWDRILSAYNVLTSSVRVRTFNNDTDVLTDNTSNNVAIFR